MFMYLCIGKLRKKFAYLLNNSMFHKIESILLYLLYNTFFKRYLLLFFKMSPINVSIIIKEVFTSNVFTYTMENDADYDLFINWLTVKIRGDFRIQDFELVDVNYRLYNDEYRGESELSPAISFQELYNIFTHQPVDQDIALYIRPIQSENATTNAELENVNVNENLPIYYPPVTEQQRENAIHHYGINVNAENQYSENRNNILWHFPLRTGTLYGCLCEICIRPYPSRNYFGCRHTFCENCIDTILNNNHQHCLYCGGTRL